MNENVMNTGNSFKQSRFVLLNYSHICSTWVCGDVVMVNGKVGKSV